jgi:hypothetical protein
LKQARKEKNMLLNHVSIRGIYEATMQRVVFFLFVFEKKRIEKYKKEEKIKHLKSSTNLNCGKKCKRLKVFVGYFSFPFLSISNSKEKKKIEQKSF